MTTHLVSARRLIQARLRPPRLIAGLGSRLGHGFATRAPRRPLEASAPGAMGRAALPLRRACQTRPARRHATAFAAAHRSQGTDQRCAFAPPLRPPYEGVWPPSPRRAHRASRSLENSGSGHSFRRATDIARGMKAVASSHVLTSPARRFSRAPSARRTPVQRRKVWLGGLDREVSLRDINTQLVCSTRRRTDTPTQKISQRIRARPVAPITTERPHQWTAQRC
jgi:hypothetical protein